MPRKHTVFGKVKPEMEKSKDFPQGDYDCILYQIMHVDLPIA